MEIKVKLIPKEDWSNLAEDAHLVVFGERFPNQNQRFDAALVAEDSHQNPMGYVTIKELSSDILHWQYGGMFPNYKGSIYSFKVYQEFLDLCRKKYKLITTLIENSNVTMLKFAMKIGFRVTGVRVFQGSILLEHSYIVNEKER